MEITELKALLNERAESVAAHLLPRGRRVRDEWEVGSVEGEPGHSLKVRLAGRKCGVWTDFAGSEGGDLIDLWMSCRNLTSLPATLDEIHAFLGVDRREPRFRASSARRRFRSPDVSGVRDLEAHSPAYDYLAGRALTAETLAAYRVAQRHSTKIGPIVCFPAYRDRRIVFVKYLGVERPAGERRFWTSGAETEKILFGWQVVDPLARVCIITEGEINAMSWYQATGVAAFATPFGGGKGGKHTEWLENEYAHLDRFERIYLAFDDDAPGRQAAEELSTRLGRHRTFVVRHLDPEYGEDANDYVRRGVGAEQFEWLLATAETLDPSTLKSAAKFVPEIIDNVFPSDPQSRGFRLPFFGATDGVGRRSIQFRHGHVSVWTGFSGHGKSSLLSQMFVEAAAQGHRVCVASMEFTPGELLEITARQLAGAAFYGATDEERARSIEAIRRAGEWLDGRFWVFDLSDAKSKTAKRDELLDTFEYAHRRYGCTQMLTDSLLCTDIAEDDYSGQKAFINRLSDQARTLGCHHHLVTHVRKEGTSESRAPSKESVRGAYAITDRVSHVFAVWRNKPKESRLKALRRSDQANRDAAMVSAAGEEDTQLVVLKNRLTGFEPVVRLYFDPESLQFREDVYSAARSYLDGESLAASLADEAAESVFPF